MFSAKRRSIIVDLSQFSGFLYMLPYCNLVSAFIFWRNVRKPIWLAKEVKQIALEGHQKCLEKLSHWVLKCKFYGRSGKANVPGIVVENRWQQ